MTEEQQRLAAFRTRNAEIVRLRAAGWKIEAIGQKFGISDGRVSQVLSKHARDPMALRKKAKRVRKVNGSVHAKAMVSYAPDPPPPVRRWPRWIAWLLNGGVAP